MHGHSTRNRSDLGISGDSSSAKAIDSDCNSEGATLIDDSSSQDSQEVDQIRDDATFGLNLPHETGVSSAPLLADPEYVFNVSDIVVSREDEREIERLYPFKAGAQYVMPSPLAFARERLKSEEVKRESPEVYMLRELAARDLSLFMRPGSIDHSTVEQVASSCMRGPMRPHMTV